MKLLRTLAFAAFACTTATLSAGTATRWHDGTAHLVIFRAANFGTNISVNIYMDGTLIGNIPYNHRFDADVPAGRHVIELEQLPRYGGDFETSRQPVRLAPGATSVFTMVTDNGGKSAVLDPS
jgi:hypothetical protein